MKYEFGSNIKLFCNLVNRRLTSSGSQILPYPNLDISRFVLEAKVKIGRPFLRKGKVFFCHEEGLADLIPRLYVFDIDTFYFNHLPVLHENIHSSFRLLHTR